MKHKFQLFFLAIVMCFVILGVKDCIDSRPIIVFIGGGSAKNYIDSLEGPKIENYTGSFYINVTSKISWITLVEEIARYDKNQYKKKPTAIVCLSADAIDSDSTFIEDGNIKSIFDQKRIVGIELGADELIVYRKGSIKGLKDSDTILSADSLEKYVGDYSVKKYTTKKESGTLRAYRRLIKDKSILADDRIINVFYDFPAEKNLDNNSLILGSKYYKPKDDSLISIKIKDTTNIKKPICIYFATYPDYRGFYRINEPIRKFIRSFKDKINKDVWNKIENNGNWKDAAEQLDHNKNGRILYLNDKLQYINPYKIDTASGK